MINKKTTILIAAKKCFLQQGFLRTSMEQIKQEAGVAKQTLYNYYASKEELLMDVIRFTLEQLKENQGLPWNLTKIKFHQPTDVEVFFRQLAHDFIENLMQPDYLALIRIIISDMNHAPRLAQLFVGEVPKHLLHNICELLKQSNEQGFTHVEHIEEAVRMFIGSLLTYVLLNGLFAQKQETIKPNTTSLDAIVQMFMQMIKRSE